MTIQVEYVEGAVKTSTKAVAHLALLLVLSVAQGAVIFFVTDPALRLGFGMLLLVAIMFSSAQLGVINHFLREARRTNYSRRRTHLRSLVDELLDEIRRLDGTALDGKRGVRDEETTAELLDAREAAIEELVGRIRDAAGEESDQPLEATG